MSFIVYFISYRDIHENLFDLNSFPADSLSDTSTSSKINIISYV